MIIKSMARTYRPTEYRARYLNGNLPGLFINSKAKQTMKSCPAMILNSGNACCPGDQALLTVRLKGIDQGLTANVFPVPAEP
jgi:hypothetical protein